MNSAVSDKNNNFYDCVKDKKVEQNNLDKIHTAEKDISMKQNIGKSFRIFFSYKVFPNK